MSTWTISEALIKTNKLLDKLIAAQTESGVKDQYKVLIRSLSDHILRLECELEKKEQEIERLKNSLGNS